MKNFIIPKPCHENWDKMMPEKKGRFCTSCAKKVYDFTEKSDYEIQEVYDEKGGNVCGKFHLEQLIQFSSFQHQILMMTRFGQKYFLKSAIVLAFLSFLLTISGCEKKIESVESTINNDKDSAKYKSSNIDAPIERREKIPIGEDSAQIDTLKKSPPVIKEKKSKAVRDYSHGIFYRNDK